MHRSSQPSCWIEYHFLACGEIWVRERTKGAPKFLLFFPFERLPRRLAICLSLAITYRIPDIETA